MKKQSPAPKEDASNFSLHIPDAAFHHVESGTVLVHPIESSDGHLSKIVL